MLKSGYSSLMGTERQQKFLRIFFYFFIFSSCSSTKPISSSPAPTEKSVESPKSLAPEIMTPSRISPGKMLLLPLGQGEMQNLICQNKPIPSFEVASESYAFITLSYFSRTKTLSCSWYNDQGEKMIKVFTVEDFLYPSERLNVDSKKVFLSAKDQARVDKEQIMLNRLYSQSGPKPLFLEPFKPPMNSKITSIYGTRRIFNHAKQSQHLGTDFRAAVGTPISSSNRGRVVFAGDLFYTGKTIIIDHGLEIFHVYGHLSETYPQAGDIVATGQVIGLSGASGRVSGPHLHWGVKIQGEYIDGYSLIAESEKLFALHP